MDVLLVLTIIRLLVPLFIFKWPLTGILFSISADLHDWQFFPFQKPEDYIFYQYWDKSLDLYYLFFAAIVVLTWKDKAAKQIALSLFALRTIGVALFFVTGLRQFLFFFPNVFENFFIFYLVYVLFSKNNNLITSVKTAFVILFSLIIPKLVHEYFMHVLNMQPWEVWDYGSRLGFFGLLQDYTNYFIWGIIFYSAPFSILIYCINKTKTLEKH